MINIGDPYRTIKKYVLPQFKPETVKKLQEAIQSELQTGQERTDITPGFSACFDHQGSTFISGQLIDWLVSNDLISSGKTPFGRDVFEDEQDFLDSFSELVSEWEFDFALFVLQTRPRRQLFLELDQTITEYFEEMNR